MRTPNTKCCICEKLLYRRPYEFKETKEFCCVSCRSELYKRRDPSINLQLGRKKGNNHLTGIRKSEESNQKRSQSHKIFSQRYPDKIKQRGMKTRGENHYNWKGGVTSINQSIRRMTEHRKWMDSVKERDGKCMRCSGLNELESHHRISFINIIIFNIKNREDARNCKELWDIDNGLTLCSLCHCKEHNRIYSPTGKGKRYDKNRTASIR
jgi:hypothetical protein